METESIIKSPKMVIDSKVVKWMEINPRFSDFSIEYLLSPSGPGGQDNRCPYKIDEESHQPQFDWLQCTRYRPPKLQRVRRKEGRQRRKPGRNPRIPFSGTQVAVLEDRFRLGHYLSSSEVERLSNLLCLSETRVKIWFQNRRARERRERELNERSRIKFVNCAEENEDEKELEEDVRERKGVETEEEKKPQRSKAVVTATAAARPHLLFKNDLNLNGPHSIVSSLRSAFSPCQPLFTKRVFNSIDQ